MAHEFRMKFFRSCDCKILKEFQEETLLATALHPTYVIGCTEYHPKPSVAVISMHSFNKRTGWNVMDDD